MHEHLHLQKIHGKEVLKLDAKKHAGEAHLLSVIGEADPDAGSAVKEARKLGLSWPTIFALLMQFGPQFVGALRAILAALATPPPCPVPETASKANWRNR